MRADAGAAPGTQWVRVTGINANGTGPHPDSRDMAFDANGDLLESDDGGIYRLVDPNTPASRVWRSVNGNIRPTEFFSVAYDSLNNVVFGGSQDNGTSRQRDPSDPRYPFNWTVVQGADGGVTGVDNDQAAHPNQTITYVSAQNLGSFTQRTFDDNNNPAGATGIGIVADTNGNTIRGVETAIINPDNSRDTLPYMTPYALNAVNPVRIIVGSDFLYERFDDGSGEFTALGGLQNVNGDTLDNDNDGEAQSPTNAQGVRVADGRG